MDASFVPKHDLSKNEAAIICYVAGYIGTKMRKRVQCSFCEQMFVTDMRLADPESDDEFIRMLSRGGLQSPSDTLFVVCRFTYIVFVALQSSKNWFTFLRSNNPASSLTKVTRNTIQLSSFSSVFVQCCRNDHSFQSYFYKIVRSFFNVLAKNFIHSSLKGDMSASTSKIKKLRSKK